VPATPLTPSLRRLVALISAVVLGDTIFYSAITPLLPGYARDLGLGATGAGILEASYAAGTLAAALPAGFLAGRDDVNEVFQAVLGGDAAYDCEQDGCQYGDMPDRMTPHIMEQEGERPTT